VAPAAAPVRGCAGGGGKAPETIETVRLVLRRPVATDAEAMFTRYARDPAVTRFLGWPTHTSIADTTRFLAFCDDEWQQRRVGPYLIHSRDDGRLLGTTGLGLESPWQAAAGYVLARDAWGNGYATEALRAMRDLASRLGVHRIYAVCHPVHHASWRVMEKCGFERRGLLHAHAQFPNLQPGVMSDVLYYAASFGTPRAW
jgi:ribosomal-protein-alanine N-acetyltransferase